MKLKAKKRSYRELAEFYSQNKKSHVRPRKPNIFFRTLMRLAALPDMLATGFKCERVGMERLPKGEPAFFLMNHSSFIDLEIVATALYPRPFNIVATTDAFIGKEWLMRQIGCIPTRKFVPDLAMIRDIIHTAKKERSSVVMFPEAGYTFDGTATTMADNLGKCAKMLGLPLCMITTHGAFLRDPLYNELQRRRVKVSATVEYLLSADEVASMDEAELNALIAEKFTFDGFRIQKESGIRVSEKFRADGLHRVLYKCPDCGTEGKMEGLGTELKCNACGALHELTEYGELVPAGADRTFPFVSDWYRWEREEVRGEIEAGRYSLDIPVTIYASFEPSCVYDVGRGRLVHNGKGFHLTSDDGAIDYTQKPQYSYSINADFNWYEIGDIISVGDTKCLYYCFPDDPAVPVAKARLAAEEMYKSKVKV